MQDFDWCFQGARSTSARQRERTRTSSISWLEMMATRYTGWANISNSVIPELSMNQRGPFFEEAAKA